MKFCVASCPERRFTIVGDFFRYLVELAAIAEMSAGQT
jgi:hypothetical protein